MKRPASCVDGVLSEPQSGQCLCIGPEGCHGGQLRYFRRLNGHLCRKHWPDKHEARASTSALYAALPTEPQLRLLMGMGHALQGPEMKQLAFEFVVENLRKDLRRLGVMPCLRHELFTHDSIMSTIHLEMTLGEVNPTSKKVLEALGGLARAILQLGATMQECAGLVFLAAVAARRFGALGFVTGFLAALGQRAADFRKTHANDMGQFLQELAIKEASWMRQRGQRPVIRAHLPHSAVADTREGNVQHFSSVDWRFLALTLPVAGATLCGTTSATGMADFVHVVRHCSGLGGTEFLLKTPLLDTVLTLHQQGVPLPGDFATWAPPGPGCRCALHLMRDRWRRRDDDARAHAYTSAHGADGIAYSEELLSFHTSLLEAKGGEIAELLAQYPGVLPAGRVWTVHDSQFVLCAFWRYTEVRQALVKSSALPGIRLYAHALTWPSDIEGLT